MYTYLICALLTYSQPYAVCWRVNVSKPSANGQDACAAIINEWLKQSAAWYAKNPDIVPAPQASCGIAKEPITLPPGARWMELGLLNDLVIKGEK